MGRKPISDTAMTPAERQQRRRAGLRQGQALDTVAVVAPDLSSLSDDALTALIEQLEAEVERRRDSVTLGSILAKARCGAGGFSG